VQGIWSKISTSAATEACKNQIAVEKTYFGSVDK